MYHQKPPRLYDLHGSTIDYNRHVYPGSTHHPYTPGYYKHSKQNPSSSDIHKPENSQSGSAHSGNKNTVHPRNDHHPYNHNSQIYPHHYSNYPDLPVPGYQPYGNNDPGYNKTFPSHRQNVTSSLSKLHTKVAKLESTLQNLNDFN